MRYKQPHSIQVVIFSSTEGAREYLLLKRLEDHGGFWQSVTGSLEEDETHLQAAVREVREETGIQCSETELIELGLVNRFEIAPLWRRRYAPGITHNREVCYALKIDRCEVRVDPLEHTAYEWVSFEDAIEMLYWQSNKQAFALAHNLID